MQISQKCTPKPLHTTLKIFKYFLVLVYRRGCTGAIATILIFLNEQVVGAGGGTTKQKPSFFLQHVVSRLCKAQKHFLLLGWFLSVLVLGLQSPPKIAEHIVHLFQTEIHCLMPMDGLLCFDLCSLGVGK